MRHIDKECWIYDYYPNDTKVQSTSSYNFDKDDLLIPDLLIPTSVNAHLGFT